MKETNLNSTQDEQKDWAHILYIEHPDLFLPELEKLRAESEAEVNGLCQIMEEFKIESKTKILDLSCGIGRHCIPLAKRGHKVVGYDPSGFFLDKARQYTESELGRDQQNILYLEGKMDSVVETIFNNREGEFGVIISLFNSIGYSSTDEDLNLFKRILELAKDGGILIIETENRDWRIRNFLPHVTYDYIDKFVCETWEFDIETSTAKSTSRFYNKDHYGKNLGLVLDLPTRMRLYSLHELKDLVNKSGWIYQKCYGNLKSLTPASLESQDLVTVSIKS